MTPRKKNASKTSPSKQSTINNFFRSKPKHAATSARPRRLAQSSLAARPLRSNRSPDLEILDLTQSTSPAKESNSPPSAKKRKIKATLPDRSPIRGARQSPLPQASSRSPSPTSYISRKVMESELGGSANSALVSPTPCQTERSLDTLEFDPDESIESSQTQYIHLAFTPPSQRILNVEQERVPAPVFTHARNKQKSQKPRFTRKSPGPTNATEEGRSIIVIPSSQGEVSEPSTPRKRDRAMLDQRVAKHTPLKAVPSNVVNHSANLHKMQRPMTTMLPLVHPISTNTPSKSHLTMANPFTPNFSSPRPIPTPLYSSDRMPSSDGDPSLEATELGTVESPPKSSKTPTAAAGLHLYAPSSRPPGQNTPRQRAATPLLPIYNINPNPPQTPGRAAQHIPPSSPANFPSPGGLMSSLGFEAPRNTSNAPPLGVINHSNTNGAEKLTSAHVSSDPPNSDGDIPGHHPREVAHSQLQEAGTPRRSRSSSLTIIPSSQPLHDSSPPPEYDLDPKRHLFNQSRMQSFNQPPVPVQSPGGFDSRLPTNSSRPYFTAETHQSPAHSSQSLPPSQSPIKGGQFDPNQSAAGMRGVFGMLGFGSEADHGGQSEAHRGAVDEEMDAHVPLLYDLPPSSPPPQTPTRRESRESSPDSYLIPASGRKGKTNRRVGKTPTLNSPLIRAFEAAKKRSKTATPSVVRRSASKTSQVASSPILHTRLDDMDLDSSPVRGSPSGNKRSPLKVSKSKADIRIPHTPTLTGRLQKAPLAAQSKGNQNARQTRTSTSTQIRKLVDQEVVDSSDAEEMDIDIQPSPVFPTSTRATAGSRGNTKSTKPIMPTTPRRYRSLTRPPEELKGQEHTLETPAGEERLPNSVSPSPIHTHPSPVRSTRYSSPPILENTQTQEESETPWESLRPSQSVSQVYERQLIEEAERERRLRMEQNAEKQEAKVLVEESPDTEKDDEAERTKCAQPWEQQESQDQEPARPVTISLDPRSPSNVPNEPPYVSLPHWFSTPKSRCMAEKQHYVVTPTRVTRRTPARATPSRNSMTPSSMMRGDGPDEEYTYVEETFNPTESQQSFLNRILLGNSNEID
ncbi:unnamed protein product [Rhizoctonia solani]|uniref:Uncharacterized protein n=1 Tax=Rhizoctonia solani TaxID=456999 RepID=A0A8H2WCE4_9AGAM|nr:unnamed protein product [Rhizoctonia solani]